MVRGGPQIVSLFLYAVESNYLNYKALSVVPYLTVDVKLRNKKEYHYFQIRTSSQRNVRSKSAIELTRPEIADAERKEFHLLEK